MVFQKRNKLEKTKIREDKKGKDEKGYYETTIPKKSIPPQIEPQNTDFSVAWTGGHVNLISGNPAWSDKQRIGEFAKSIINDPQFQPALIDTIAQNQELVEKILEERKKKNKNPGNQEDTR